jgi:hypothetical protein
MSETAFRNLVAAIDGYIAGLAFPGRADVQAGIAAARQTDPRPVEQRPSVLCDAHLPGALSSLAGDGHAALASAIAAAAPHLTWVTYDAYPAAEIGDFAVRHAFASLIGEGAPYAGHDFDLGLFLIAPDTLYRDHQHAAPELYAPLTGPHFWRFDEYATFVAKPAHEPVWNEPWQVHATLTGAVPFLSIFCWTSDVSAPARIVWPEPHAVQR